VCPAPVDYLTLSRDVLAHGLPREPPPDALAHDVRWPVARAEHAGFAAVLFLARRSDGGHHVVFTLLERAGAEWAMLEEGDDEWELDPFRRASSAAPEVRWLGWTGIELEESSVTVVWGAATAPVSAVRVAGAPRPAPSPVAPTSGAYVVVWRADSPGWFEGGSARLMLEGLDDAGRVVAVTEIAAR
jgi:hypothetical protein